MENEYDEFDTDCCEICGEVFEKDAQIAEMYNPDENEGSYVCHAQCGLDRDYLIA